MVNVITWFPTGHDLTYPICHLEWQRSSWLANGTLWKSRSLPPWRQCCLWKLLMFVYALFSMTINMTKAKENQNLVPLLRRCMQSLSIDKANKFHESLVVPLRDELIFFWYESFVERVFDTQVHTMILQMTRLKSDPFWVNNLMLSVAKENYVLTLMVLVLPPDKSSPYAYNLECKRGELVVQQRPKECLHQQKNVVI